MVRRLTCLHLRSQRYHSPFRTRVVFAADLSSVVTDLRTFLPPPPPIPSVLPRTTGPTVHTPIQAHMTVFGSQHQERVNASCAVARLAPPSSVDGLKDLKECCLVHGCRTNKRRALTFERCVCRDSRDDTYKIRSPLNLTCA